MSSTRARKPSTLVTPILGDKENARIGAKADEILQPVTVVQGRFFVVAIFVMVATTMGFSIAQYYHEHGFERGDSFKIMDRVDGGPKHCPNGQVGVWWDEDVDGCLIALSCDLNTTACQQQVEACSDKGHGQHELVCRSQKDVDHLMGYGACLDWSLSMINGVETWSVSPLRDGNGNNICFSVPGSRFFQAYQTLINMFLIIISK